MVEKENKANEILKYLQTGKELSTMQGIELFIQQVLQGIFRN